MSHPPPAGATGQQDGFLAKCWAEATPSPSGQQRGSGGSKPGNAVAAPATPDLPRPLRGNRSADSDGVYALLPRDPGGSQESPSSEIPPKVDGSWAELIAGVADESLRAGMIAWPEDARDVFLERLGIGDDNGMDTAPGSEAWNIAAAEARRVAAGIPQAVSQAIKVGTIDHVLAAFAPLGGLTFKYATAKADTSVTDDAEGTQPQ